LVILGKLLGLLSQSQFALDPSEKAGTDMQPGHVHAARAHKRGGSAALR